MPNLIPPIREVAVYKNDVVVIRDPGNPPNVTPERGAITEFSKRSRQRLAFVAANTDVEFKTMITLTYPLEFPSDGEKVKANFKAFLEWLTRDLGSRPNYLWFLEFQSRGAPHFHLLIDYELPRIWVQQTLHVGDRDVTRQVRNEGNREELRAFRFRVSGTWYRIVGSGDYKHLQAGTRVERVRKPGGASRYAVKYALKMYQKLVPAEYQNVGRFWGCSQDVMPICRQRHRVTEDDVRGALEGWKYAPPDDKPLWTVLYGVSPRFTR